MTSHCYLACLAGGMHERARPPYFSRAKPARNFRAAKPRVKFPPATFRMVFACRPLLSLLMNQLNKPIRERSVTWNLRLFIFYARNGPKACDSSEINLWFTWRSPITRRNVLHSHLCTSCASNFRRTEYLNTDNWKTTITLNTSQLLLFTEVSTSTKWHQRKSCKPIKSS